MIEKFDKNLTDIFYTEALNFHLLGENQGLNIAQVAAEGVKKGMNMSEIQAVTEQDGWKYTGQYHDGESYVCSTLVARLWKAAGLFGDMEINAAEWSPKDIYQVKFFDSDQKDKRPQQCKDADPNGQFCQLLGKYRMQFPGYNTVTAYPYMNDNCPSLAPDFFRPD